MVSLPINKKVEEPSNHGYDFSKIAEKKKKKKIAGGVYPDLQFFSAYH